MPARELPARPNLAQYKKQAKALVKAYQSGDEIARRRVREHHPRLRPAAKPSPVDDCGLADAQLVIAREHGFDSWPKFKQHIESVSPGLPAAEVWKTAEDAIVAGDVGTLDRGAAAERRCGTEICATGRTETRHITRLHSRGRERRTGCAPPSDAHPVRPGGRGGAAVRRHHSLCRRNAPSPPPYRASDGRPPASSPGPT